MGEQFRVSAVKSPDLADGEVRRRLAAVYRIILQARRPEEANGTDVCSPRGEDAPREAVEQESNVL